MLNPKTLALANTVLNLLLLLVVLRAASLARQKRFQEHCAVLRVAFPVQLTSIALIMLPSMIVDLRELLVGPMYITLMLAHHAIGLVVMGIWVYVNLVMKGILHRKSSLAPLMRIAFFSWIVAIVGGIYLYYAKYVGG